MLLESLHLSDVARVDLTLLFDLSTGCDIYHVPESHRHWYVSAFLTSPCLLVFRLGFALITLFRRHK